MAGNCIPSTAARSLAACCATSGAADARTLLTGGRNVIGVWLCEPSSAGRIVHGVPKSMHLPWRSSATPSCVEPLPLHAPPSSACTAAGSISRLAKWARSSARTFSTSASLTVTGLSRRHWARSRATTTAFGAITFGDSTRGGRGGAGGRSFREAGWNSQNIHIHTLSEWVDADENRGQDRPFG